MKPTSIIRHVWRTVSDGNEELKVLALQQLWINDLLSSDLATVNSNNVYLWKSNSDITSRNYEWRDVIIDNIN